MLNLYEDGLGPPRTAHHYPAFTNSKIVDHNNVSMNSLLSSSRTPYLPPPSPFMCHPSLPALPASPHCTLSSLFPCSFSTYPDSRSRVLPGRTSRSLPNPSSPVTRPTQRGRGNRTHLSSPPYPPFFAFTSNFFSGIIPFHRLLKGARR